MYLSIFLSLGVSSGNSLTIRIVGCMLGKAGSGIRRDRESVTLPFRRIPSSYRERERERESCGNSCSEWLMLWDDETDEELGLEWWLDSEISWMEEPIAKRSRRRTNYEADGLDDHECGKDHPHCFERVLYDWYRYAAAALRVRCSPRYSWAYLVISIRVINVSVG